MTKNTYIENNLAEQFKFWSPILFLSGSLLFILFAALDYLTVPEYFITLLVWRIATACGLLLFWLVAIKYKQQGIRFHQNLVYFGIVGATLTVEGIVLRTGGHTSPHYIGMGLIGIWVIIFLPTSFRFSLLNAGTIYAMYLLPILADGPIVEVRSFVVANTFLLSLLTSSLLLRTVNFTRLVNELGLKYDLEEHRNRLEDLIVDRTQKLTDTVDILQAEIFDRMQAEQALKRASDEWRATFDSTKDVIMMLDRDFAVLRTNKAATLFWNCTFPEVIGKEFTELFRCNEMDQRTNPLSLMTQSRRHEESELYLSDRHHWVLLSADPLLDAEQKLAGAVVIIRDITDHRKAEEEQRKLRDELLQIQKMDSIGRLAGAIAHDFNNILSAIIGFSRLALRKVSDNDPAAEDLRIINESGERAAALTRQLLAFSRKQVLKMEVVNLNTVIENMIKMIGRLIGAQIVLDLRLCQPLGNIVADVGQLEQILMNLLVNARDAMPAGGHIAIETAETGPEEGREQEFGNGPFIMLSVIDTGTGMSPDVRERIFEPFFTTKGRGKGTGLGLSTVYGIVKQHNGHIMVHSTLGQGTTFKLYFPLIDLEVETSVEIKQSVPRGGAETVLVVDDEPMIVKLATETLRPLGYNLLVAASGEEALKTGIAYPGTINLLLTDVVMPGMNGVRLADSLRQQRPGIRVLFMTGYDDDAFGSHKNTEALLQKPLEPVVLANKVREVLDQGAPNEVVDDTSDRGGRILYADDDEANRLLVQRLLEGSLYQLDLCENGAIAVNKYKQGCYAAVLMDMQMPVMDGISACRSIRLWERERGTSPTPIIALSGAESTEEIRTFLDAGGTASLAKPISGEALRASLGQHAPLRMKPTDQARSFDVHISRDLQNLVPRYVENRKTDVLNLRKAAEAGDYETIRIVGHSMKGSGGGYGFDEITNMGKRLEEAAKGQDSEACGQTIDEFADYLNRVRLTFV